MELAYPCRSISQPLNYQVVSPSKPDVQFCILLPVAYGVFTDVPNTDLLRDDCALH
jgi:hypothetical protein